MIAIVVFCPVKFVEEPTATRLAFVASVRVSAGERAKSDRVKIGARVRAPPKNANRLYRFFFAFAPVFARPESEELFIRTDTITMRATTRENISELQVMITG